MCRLEESELTALLIVNSRCHAPPRPPPSGKHFNPRPAVLLSFAVAFSLPFPLLFSKTGKRGK